MLFTDARVGMTIRERHKAANPRTITEVCIPRVGDRYVKCESSAGRKTRVSERSLDRYDILRAVDPDPSW